jgi:hypothetical protein
MADGESFIILGNNILGNNTQFQTSLNRTGFVEDNGGDYAFRVTTSGPPSNQPDVRVIAIGGIADNGGNAGVVGIVETTDALRGMGVLGRSDNGPGVLGLSDNSFGVRGQSGSADLLPPVGGGAEFQICGVQGSSDNGTGVRGDSAKHVGVRGRSLLGDGVFGSCNGPNTRGNGIHGQAPGHAQDAQTGPFAGRFDNDVTISGNLFVAGALIAGPGKPLHQIVFAGTVALDAKGESVITLPEGVGDLHGEFAYQLTSVGAPAPDLHVAQQIREGKFKVAGGASGSSVSWQVTGMFKPTPVAVEYASEQIDEKEAQKCREQMEALAKVWEQHKK